MGGAAILGSTPIKKNEVLPTIEDFVQNFVNFVFDTKFTDKDYSIVGSAGKKPQSGDVDFVFDEQKILEKYKDFDNFDVFLSEYCSTHNVDYHYLSGFHIFSIGWRINGDENRICQIDMMPVRSVEYSKWGMWSEEFSDNKPYYKSGVRNSVIYWALSEMTTEVIERDEDGLPLTIIRSLYDCKNGYSIVNQTWRGKKGRLKNKKTLSNIPCIDKCTPEYIIWRAFGKSVDNPWNYAGLDEILKLLEDSVCLSNEQKKRIIENVIAECEYKHFDYPVDKFSKFLNHENQ